jgi:oxygen-independent coproporphyrinogen-3 oxidase
LDDGLLRRLGRLHTVSTFLTCFQSARRAGFSNINVDLMYGLPGQTLEGWRSTVDQLLSLAPDHVSAYGLTVEEETYFHRSGVETEEDLQATMYEEAAALMERAGMVHYEISNFTRPGMECRHNLRYWRNQDCLGAGVSAAGYWGGVRRTNPDRLSAYLDHWEGRGPMTVETTALSPLERLGEDLLLGLRLREGVRLTDAVQRHYGPVLDRFGRLGFLEKEGDRWRPTRLGWRLSNQMFQHFLEPAA